MPAMVHRRGFFQMLAAASWAWTPATLRAVEQARRLVRSGAIGKVVFCRASDAQWLRRACEISLANKLIADIDHGDDCIAEGAVLLGSAGTLIVSSRRCRIVP